MPRIKIPDKKNVLCLVFCSMWSLTRAAWPHRKSCVPFSAKPSIFTSSWLSLLHGRCCGLHGPHGLHGLLLLHDLHCFHSSHCFHGPHRLHGCLLLHDLHGLHSSHCLHGPHRFHSCLLLHDLHCLHGRCWL